MKPKFPFRRKKQNDKSRVGKLGPIRRIPEDVEDEFLYYYRQHRPQNAYPDDYMSHSYSFPLPSSMSSSAASDLTCCPVYRDMSSSRDSSEYDFGSCYSSLPRVNARPMPPSIATLPRAAPHHPHLYPASTSMLAADDLSGRMQLKLHLNNADAQSRDSGHSSTASPDLRGLASLRQRRRIQPWFDMGHHFNRQIDESSDYSFCSARCASGDVDEDSGVGSVTCTNSSSADNPRPTRPELLMQDEAENHWSPAEDSEDKMAPCNNDKPETIRSSSIITKDHCVLHFFRLLWKATKAILVVMTCVFFVLASLSCLEEFNCRQPKVIDVAALAEKINASIFGQEVAVGVLLDSLGSLRNSSGMMTALLFFGWTGTGKSLMVQLVSEAFGLGSVHRFSMPLHLGDEANHVMLDDLAVVLHEKKSCGPSLVIFEDVDEGTDAAMAKLKAFIRTIKDSHVLLVVTMSSGGQAINRSMLEGAKSSTLKREEVDVTLVDQIMQDHHIDLPLRSHMLDQKIHTRLVPFLPLTREHVKQCIVKEVLLQGGGAPTRQDVRHILDEMEFFSDSFPLFAATGCKRVAGKVAFLLASKDTFLGIA